MVARCGLAVGPEAGVWAPKRDGEGDGRGSRGASYRTLSRSTAPIPVGAVWPTVRDYRADPIA